MKNAELGETSPLDLSYMNQKIREKKSSVSDKSQSLKSNKSEKKD